MLKIIWLIIRDLPSILEERNNNGKWFNRILFFTNWIPIIQIPCIILVKHEHVPTLTLLAWGAVCLYTYHWYFSCEFPWQKKDKDK